MVAIDIAMRSFHMLRADARGKVRMRKKLTCKALIAITTR